MVGSVYDAVAWIAETDYRATRHSRPNLFSLTTGAAHVTFDRRPGAQIYLYLISTRPPTIFGGNPTTYNISESFDVKIAALYCVSMLGNVQCSHITAILMPALPPVAVGSSSATESWAEDAQEISSLILVIRINNVNTYIIIKFQR